MRCRCGRGEPSRGADVAGVSPVLVQIWPHAACRLLHDSAMRLLCRRVGTFRLRNSAMGRLGS